MNRYLKLVNFEFNRFFKLYLVLIGITIVTQIIGVIYDANKYLADANEAIYKDLMPKSQFIEARGLFSLLKLVESPWFLGPIAICATVLLIYVFFIWYRDWLGKNTFSYRLLMLPTSRLNIYLAKATTIVLFVLGLIALQLLLFLIEGHILKWIVPDEFRRDVLVYEITDQFLLNILYPGSFIDFLIHYGLGITGVFVIFTAILFERSYRFKGIIYGMVYVALSFVVLILPILINGFVLKNYFFVIEIFFMEVFCALLVLAGAILIGNYLIKNKIMA